MTRPVLSSVDHVDGTLYVIYEDGTIWAYRSPAKERLLEGWREVEGGPAVDREGTSAPSS